MKLKFSSLVVLATVQVLSIYMCLVAIILEGAGLGHSRHYRKFYWTMLLRDFLILTL